MSLNNLSVHLDDAGRWEEELAAIEEDVGIRRSRVEGNPAAYLPVSYLARQPRFASLTPTARPRQWVFRNEAAEA